jgi:hypothetical protein
VLLPEIVHLPAIMLLVMVVGSGIAMPAAVPFALSVAHSPDGSWLTAIGAIVLAVIANLTTWFGFRRARRALPTAHFLGFSSRIWSIAIPLAYLAGVGNGIYLCALFYF